MSKLTQEELIAKRVTVRKQYEEIFASNTVTCSCGKGLDLKSAFKCRWCGEYYCAKCGEEHFAPEDEGFDDVPEEG